MEQKRDALEVTTRVIRGALRYRNQGTIQVLALLVGALDEAAQILTADANSLGAMVIVDPEYEQIWQERAAERRLVLNGVCETIALVRSASRQAREELQAEGPTDERQGSDSDNQGQDQSG